MRMPDLFPELVDDALGDGAVLLRGFVTHAGSLAEALHTLTATAPFRHMATPGGHLMSVAMTNCGAYGWVTDRRGYRYTAADPQTNRPWPPMPPHLLTLAQAAATQAGYPNFTPDACLINRYDPGAKMAPHQDKDEADFTAPIVSVSLGLPATFLWGGATRKTPTRKIPLSSGDIIVWGGPTRLHFHGIAPLADGTHPVFGRCRINLTFRKAR